MSSFLSPRLKGLKEYVPGEQPDDFSKFIKLNTNESPFPPSPLVLERLNGDAVSKLNLYPPIEGKSLARKLGELYGLSGENVILTNGSDETLSYCFFAFCDSDKGMAFPDISYGFYRVFADLYGIPFRAVPLDGEFRIVTADYYNSDMNIVIANPNAPTGICLSLSEVEKIVSTNPQNVVIIDEAYIDFGGESAAPLVKKYGNLIVIQTYSKSRSLAGGRLGFALACPELIADLNKIKFSQNPYNVNRLTFIAGEAALDDPEYFESCRSAIISERERLNNALVSLGFTVLPSKANFVFARHNTFSGGELYRRLKEKGILVRHFNAPLIDEYLRITVGLPKQTDALIANLKIILGM